MDILITAIVAWMIAQFTKIIIEFTHTKKLNFALLWASGGMPSSHSAFVTAATIKIGLTLGIMSPIFGACAVFSPVIMYDADGVRRSVGQQAKAINNIQFHINNITNLIFNTIKEVCGHTVFQVLAGTILGLAVALLSHI